MNNIFDLNGQVALVTGASGGLGRRFSLTLARAGARVVLGARRMDKLRVLADEIASQGGRAVPVEMDVTSAQGVRRALSAGEEAFGDVTIVVNNSGVASERRALELEEGEWDRVIDTNLKGAWLVSTEAARRMVDKGAGGAIINVASILAIRVAGGVAPYAASKAGLAHLTRALALEWARHNIRVNAIAPGYILTDMNRAFFESPASEAAIKRIPQRRIGAPEDLDGALLLLASDASRYMTGSTIVVDGGHLQSSL